MGYLVRPKMESCEDKDPSILTFNDYNIGMLGGSETLYLVGSVHFPTGSSALSAEGREAIRTAAIAFCEEQIRS